MNKRGKTREEWELIGAKVWASRSADSVSGHYYQTLHDVMISVMNGESMESYKAQAEPSALLEAAELLASSGHEKIACELVEQVATMQVLSLTGPLTHRLNNAGRRKNPHWPLIMDLAESEIRNHPHRRYSALNLAKIVRDRFKKSQPGVRESEIPKVETISGEISELAKKSGQL
ncbi:TPA: hypothetical protein ACN33S_004778 [Vibrio parahaemolyticus]